MCKVYLQQAECVRSVHSFTFTYKEAAILFCGLQELLSLKSRDASMMVRESGHTGQLNLTQLHFQLKQEKRKHHKHKVFIRSNILVVQRAAIFVSSI